MPDDIPLGEEPHIALLRLGLAHSQDRAFRAKLAAAIFARGAGTPVDNESELIKAVEKLIGRRSL